MQNRSLSLLSSVFEPFPGFDWDDSKQHPMLLSVTTISKVHYHDMVEVAICLEGTGELLVEEELSAFEPGDVAIIFPFQRHYSCKTGSGTCNWYWLYLDPLNLLSELGVSDLPRIERLLRSGMGIYGKIDRQRHPLIAELIKRIALPGNKDLRLTCLYTMIKELAEESRNLPHLSFTPTQCFSEVAPAIELVRQSLEKGEAPTVDAMSRACAMSIVGFRRAFRIATGQSPQDHIEACQMRKAQYLLLGTNQAISQIAQSVGYHDVSGFNRQFLTHFQMTPREYRSLNLRQGDAQA